MDAPPRPPRKALATLYAVATLASLAVGPDGPRYWDSFGYVIQALTGRVGGLMLGRPAFVLISHEAARLWLALGGEVRATETMLRAFWMLVSATAAPALALIASATGLSIRAACFAGLALALSPTVAHTSRAVLTDAPSMAATLWAFVLALEAIRRRSVFTTLVAGALLGLAAGMREQSILQAASLVAIAACAPTKRGAHAFAAMLGCALVFAGPVAWLAHTQHDYVATIEGWLAAMRSERSQHPYGARDFGMFVAWAVASSPIAWILVARGAGDWRDMLLGQRQRAALVLPSVAQFAALAFYQDIAFSPRYLLGALPCALILPAAWSFDRMHPGADVRIAAPTTPRSPIEIVWALALVVPTLLAAVAVPLRERTLRDGLAALPHRIATLPPRAAIVTGQLCPAVVYERELSRAAGQRLDIMQVCPGWRWPPALHARLDALRGEGRVVVIDLRRASWLGERQQRCLREAERYVGARPEEHGVIVWR